MNIINKYQIIKEIGRGATSTVYLAIDSFTKQKVALKVFNVYGSNNKTLRKLLMNEASLAGKLSHPNIVRILDSSMDEYLNYVAMEYIDGETLERFTDANNLLPLIRVAEIAYKCCRALEYAQHQGVIHRDIKPANILLCGNNDIKISDFGASVIENQHITQVNGVGSPAYMSPEQIKELQLSHQTDIYSLGVTMYKLLTGRLPFNATNNYSMIYQIMNVNPHRPSIYRPEIPYELDAIVLRAMCKDTAKRYQTWDEMAQDLTSFMTDYIWKFKTISEISFFKQFSDAELWEVIRIGKWRNVQKNDQILREGEEGQNFFIIVNGSVRIVKQGRLLSLLHKGDCFGEMAHLTGKGARRSTDVFAKTDVKLIEIDPEMLALASSECRYQFSNAFLHIIIKRLRISNVRIVRLFLE